MKIKYMKPSEIIPYENNPRNNDGAVKAVAASIEKFGWQQPIVVDANNIIIIGHTRWKAAITILQSQTVPVLVASKLTDEQVGALRIADNKTGEIASWDYELLAPELMIVADDIDWTEFGFKEEELNNLLNSIEEDIEDDDKDETLPPSVNKVCSYGDIWELGRHRLVCGDALNGEDIVKLFGNEKVDLHITFPPCTESDENNPLESIIEILNNIANTHTFGFCVGGTNNYWNKYIETANKNKLQTLAWNVWNKYHPTNNVQKKTLIPATHNWMITFGNEDNLSKAVKRKCSNMEAIQNIGITGSSLHPDIAPVGLVQEYINTLTEKGSNVADCFGGTGTTLIAAEKLGRKCFLMEIEAKYCDIIIKRWEDYTGKKARRINE